MKFNITFIVIALFSFIACNNDEDGYEFAACNVNNPIEDLQWLKSMVDSIKADDSALSKYYFLEIAEYKDETIFISNNCCPICSTVISVYKCNGEFFDFLTSEISSNLKNRRIIFKRNDFVCSKN